jgi:hypothetical protein
VELAELLRQDSLEPMTVAAAVVVVVMLPHLLVVEAVPVLSLSATIIPVKHRQPRSRAM